MGLPEKYRVQPAWIVRAVLVALLAALIIGDPGRIDRQRTWLRVVTGIVIACIALANLYAAARLVNDVLTSNKIFASNATGLLATGGVIWLTNVIAFGLWYWDLDRGGAAARAHHPDANPAFILPEMPWSSGHHARGVFSISERTLSILFPKNVSISWDDSIMCSPGMTARDEVLAGLAALGPGATNAVELLGQVRDLAGFIDRAQGELARLAAALDAVDGAAEAGYSSTAAFLRHGCGRSAGRAGELVATGRALRALAATGKALMAGEISFDAAHVICRAAAQIPDPAMVEVAEEQMLAFARIPAPDEPTRGPDGPDDGGPEPDGTQPEPDGGQPEPNSTDAGSDEAPGQPAGPGPWWAAPALDPGQLRRLGEELIYRADQEAAEERERKRFERRHLSFGFTLDHTGTITGACGDTLSAEIIKTAVHAFGPPLGTEDLRTAAQRRMDGLTAACQAALDSGAAGTRHGAAPHLSILVEEQTLAGADGTTVTGSSKTGAPGTGPSAATCSYTACSYTAAPGTTRTSGAACSCTAGTGPASGTGAGPAPTGTPAPPGPPPARTGYGAMLTARQVLALACRADLSVIRWRDGIPLDVGRRYRTETPAIRRALETRDHGCRFTGCGMPAVWSTAHHLKPWSEGGVTSLNDTALFCFVHHHYYIHLLGWTVSGDPNGTLRFTHPNGWLTLDSPLPSQNKPRAP